MALTWLAVGLPGERRYQPRHRSTGKSGSGFDDPDPYWMTSSSGLGSGPARSDSSAERPEIYDDYPVQDFLGQMTSGEIRRILEGCALDDPTAIVPDLVRLVAHAAHTPATLASAWSQFEEATRGVYALRFRTRGWPDPFRRDEPAEAFALTQGYADEAWRTITLGPLAEPSRASAGHGR